MENKQVFKRRICPAFEIGSKGGCRRFLIDIEYANGVLKMCGIWHSQGQIYDQLTDESLVPNSNYVYEDLLEIQRIWKRYHLNDMRAGTPKQEEFVREWQLTHAYDYTEVCKALSEADLLYDNGYKYGSSWLREEVPLEVIKYLFSLSAISGASWFDIDDTPVDTEEFLKLLSFG